MANQHDQTLLDIFKRLVKLLGDTGITIDDQTTWLALGMDDNAVAAFVEVQCREEFGIALDSSDAGKTVSDLAVSIQKALP